MSNQLAKFLRAEIKTINRTLASHKVDAGCRLKDTLVGGRSLILYRVLRGRGVRIADVEKLLPEIAEALGERRGQRTPVRLQTSPVAIEAPHPRPAPTPLTTESIFALETHTMLCGRSYDYSGAQDEIVDLESEPHTLIAGTTGAGKSVLMRNMLLSLAANTDPADLHMVLIDLKNSDLRPLRTLPHATVFAHTKDDAAAAIAAVHHELDRRISERDAGARVIVAIDELARLNEDKGTMGTLNDILATGRSERINVVAATQHPTKELLGKLSKVNFSVRLLGLVADAGTAQVAGGRPGTNAHMLPGRGSFLRIAGAEMTRFQSYYTDEAEFDVDVDMVRLAWGSVASSYKVGSTPSTLPLVPQKRDKIDELAEQIADMWADGASKNAMCKHALGRAYGGSYAAKLDRAIERLEASTTPADAGAKRSAERPNGDNSAGVVEANIWM